MSASSQHRRCRRPETMSASPPITEVKCPDVYCWGNTGHKSETPELRFVANNGHSAHTALHALTDPDITDPSASPEARLISRRIRHQPVHATAQQSAYCKRVPSINSIRRRILRAFFNQLAPSRSPTWRFSDCARRRPTRARHSGLVWRLDAARQFKRGRVSECPSKYYTSERTT